MRKIVIGILTFFVLVVGLLFISDIINDKPIFSLETLTEGTPIFGGGGAEGSVESAGGVEIAAAPSVSIIKLNSTNPATNNTDENLTAYAVVNGGDGTSEQVWNWYVNRTFVGPTGVTGYVPLIVLNMPFENNGSSAGTQDYAKFALNATEYNTPSWNGFSGRDGNGSYTLDGSDDYLETIYDTAIDINTNFTISMWINYSASHAGFPFAKREASTEFEFIFIMIADECSTPPSPGTKICYLTEGTEGTFTLTTDASTYNDGRWHHVAATRENANTMKLYVDGQLIGTNTSAAFDLFNGKPISLGRPNDVSNFYFDGGIDDLTIWNRTLGPEQILALWENRTDMIVSNETEEGEGWNVEIIPLDGVNEGISGKLDYANDHPYFQIRGTIPAPPPTTYDCGDNVTESATLSSSDSITSTICTGYGLNITADNIVLDCAGLTITGDEGTANDNALIMIDRNNVTVKNCNFQKFGDSALCDGVFCLSNSDNNHFQNITVFTNISDSGKIVKLVSLLSSNNNTFNITNITSGVYDPTLDAALFVSDSDYNIFNNLTATRTSTTSSYPTRQAVLWLNGSSSYNHFNNITLKNAADSGGIVETSHEIYFTLSSTVSGNIFDGGRTEGGPASAIYTAGGSNNTFQNLEINTTVSRDDVGGAGAQIDLSTNLKFFNNTFKTTSGYGIIFISSFGSGILKNNKFFSDDRLSFDLDGNSESPLNVLFDIDVSNINMKINKSIYFLNSSSSGTTLDNINAGAIYISRGASNHIIINNNLTETEGIQIIEANNITITNNIITPIYNASSLYLSTTENSSIQDNTVSQNYTGASAITISEGGKNTITNNTVNANPGNGISLLSSGYNTFINNTLSSTIDSAFILGTSAGNNTIKDTIISTTTGSGVNLSSDSYNNSFEGLIIETGGTGIILRGVNHSFTDTWVNSSVSSCDATTGCDIRGSSILSTLNFINLTLVSPEMVLTGSYSAYFTNFTLENITAAITYPNLSREGGGTFDLAEYVTLGSNLTRISGTANVFRTMLNTSAQLTFRGLSTANSYIALIDAEDDGSYESCPSTTCTNAQNTSDTYSFNVTGWTSYAVQASSFSTPPATECDGSRCTDLSPYDFTTIQNVPGFIWHDANDGLIIYNVNVNFSGIMSVDAVLEFGPSYISIDADNAQGLNVSANVSLNNINCNQFNFYYAAGDYPTVEGIVANGTLIATQSDLGGDCTDTSLCTDLVCEDSTLNFTAIHFDSFGVGAGAGTQTDAISIVSDKLNFWNITDLSQEKNHTVTITWNGGNYTGTQIVYFELPTEFNFSQEYQDDLQNNCGNQTTQGYADSDVVCYCDSILQRGNCSVNSAAENLYRFMITPQNPNPLIEQTVFTLLANVTNGSNTFSPSSNLKFLKINDREIFYSLIEFGRGRGNYFLTTFAEDVAGSGFTGQACNAVPADSLFELNYLHKVNNIKQYFGIAQGTATDAIFTCTYPNNSIIRQHLPIEITRDPTWNITYKIPEIEGSWERQSYVGQDFDIYETPAGTIFNVNCTDMVYTLDAANGNVTVEKDNFFVETRPTNPLIINGTADPLTPIVGNGTSEILFNYNITNNETYEIREVTITIKAPQYAQFIGVRGELWGVARDRYTLQLARLQPGESTLLTLVARFNTTDAPPGVTALNTSDGIEVAFNPCWEINAYNPNEYFQDAAAVGSIPLDMSINTSIVNLQNIINNINLTIININQTVTDISGTVTNINNTVNNIENIVYNINQTVNYINSTLLAMNASFDIQSILGNLSLSINLTSNLNTTLQSNITDILNALRDINGSLISINQTLFLEIQNLSFNIQGNFSSIFTNLTLILQKIDNISVNTSADIQSVNDSVSLILSRVQRLQEFDEELVFLVTDSFGLVQQAAADVNAGNQGAAIQKLEESNEKLTEASTRLLALQQQIQTGIPATTKTSRSSRELLFPILIFLLIAIAIIGGFLYLRSRDDN